MASYLVEISYKDNAVAKRVRIGMADGVFPDVLSRAIDTAVNNRINKGENPTEVSAIVVEAN